MINFMIKFILKKVASFEKYKDKMDELSFRTEEIFVLQFINTAVIIFVININFGIELPLGADNILKFILEGEYYDISPNWYNKIGTMIVITVLINTISTPFKYYGFQFFMYNLRRFIDRGYSLKEVKNNKTLTK